MKSNKVLNGILSAILLVIIACFVAVFALPNLQGKIADSLVEKSQKYQDSVNMNEELTIDIQTQEEIIHNLNLSVAIKDENIQQLNNLIEEKEGAISLLQERKILLELALENSNADLESSLLEIEEIMEEVNFLTGEIANLNTLLTNEKRASKDLVYKINYLTERINELNNINSALSSEGDFSLNLIDNKGYYFNIWGFGLTDYTYQRDYNVFTRQNFINASANPQIAYKESIYYNLRVQSLNINSSIEKSTYYEVVDSTEVNIVIEDWITGEEYNSVTEYIQANEGISNFVLNEDYHTDVELLPYTELEARALGLIISSTYAPLKRFDAVIKIQPLYTFTNGIYVSSDGDVLELNNNMQVFYNGYQGFYSYQGAYIDIYDFAFDSGIERGDAHIIGDNSISWNGKTFILSNN